MESLKVSVDILSSIASFIAIVTVLYSWYSAKKDPIKISETIVSKFDPDTFRFIVKLKNKKPYPVIVKSMTCYKRKTYRVEKKRMECPKTMSVFDTRDRLFTIQDETVVSELGEHRVETRVKADIPPLKSLIFMADTSHGFLTLRCKNVKYFSTETEVFSPEFMVSKSSKLSSWPAYIRGYLVHAIDLLPFKLKS